MLGNGFIGDAIGAGMTRAGAGSVKRGKLEPQRLGSPTPSVAKDLGCTHRACHLPALIFCNVLNMHCELEVSGWSNALRERHEAAAYGGKRWQLLSVITSWTRV